LLSPPGLATGVSFFFDPALGAAFGLEGRAASSAARSASFSAFFFAARQLIPIGMFRQK
jgi:hypothetical protein